MRLSARCKQYAAESSSGKHLQVVTAATFSRILVSLIIFLPASHACVGHDSGAATTTSSVSYRRINFSTSSSTTTIPYVFDEPDLSVFDLKFTGQMFSNTNPRRFSTAQDHRATISTLTDASVSECGTACEADTACLGFAFWQVSPTSRQCILLNDIGTQDGDATGLQILSYAKIVPTTTTQ